MTSFTTGKSASKSVSKGGSISTGSFKIVSKSSSNKSKVSSSSFKVGKVPDSAFSVKGQELSTISAKYPDKTSFSTSGTKKSSFNTGNYNPTILSTPIKAVITTPVKISFKVTDNYLGTNVKKTTGKFVQPVLVTTNNNSVDKIKPITPTRTITFKQATSSKINPTLPVKSSTKPIYKTVPVSNQEIIENVKKFKSNYISSPPTTSPSTTLINSKAGSGKSTGKWGGTGSLASTSSLSSDEKSKKGITGSSYTQGSDKIKRIAKSYNTGKNEKM